MQVLYIIYNYWFCGSPIDAIVICGQIIDMLSSPRLILSLTFMHVTEVAIANYTTSALSEVCNFAKGKWVVDDQRPLYSGFSCKRWLSGMWACRMTQRMNFDYETLKWQPKDCQMEEFEGSKFLKRYSFRPQICN